MAAVRQCQQPWKAAVMLSSQHASLYMVIFNLMIYFFSPQNSLYRHNRFSTLSFSMKIAESGKLVLVGCIIDFKDIQLEVWLKQFSLNLNACKVMMVFFKFWSENLKKTIITLSIDFHCFFTNHIHRLHVYQQQIKSSTYVKINKIRVVNTTTGMIIINNPYHQK